MPDVVLLDFESAKKVDGPLGSFGARIRFRHSHAAFCRSSFSLQSNEESDIIRSL